MLQIVASLTDSSKAVIYNCKLYIVQTPEYYAVKGAAVYANVNDP